MADNIERTLGNIEGKLDAFLDKQKEQDTRLNNHSGRIASLEQYKAKAIGIVAFIVFLTGFALKVIK
jgi:hypothetical protein